MKPVYGRLAKGPKSLEESFEWSKRRYGEDWQLTLEEYRAVWRGHDWSDRSLVMLKRDVLLPYVAANVYVRVWRGDRVELRAQFKEALRRMEEEDKAFQEERRRKRRSSKGTR